MAATVSFFRTLAVSLFLSTVFAAFSTVPNPVPLRRPLDTSHLKQRFDVPSTLPRQAINAGGLFGDTEGTRRFKLRQRLQTAIHFISRNKRKKLAALVFAVSVWLRVIPQQEVPAAHAEEVPAAVEQVENIVGGSSEATDVETPPTVETEKKMAVNGKLAATVAGAIILPSAGVLVARGRKNGEPEGDEGEITEESENKTSDSTSPNQKRDPVQSVLGLTRKARPKVNADTFLKTLQQEKSVIKSAINKLTNQLESNEESAVSEAGTAISSESSDPVSPAEDEGSLPTNSELPLMTSYFIQARQQPKDPREEELLKQKYEAIEDVGERAFNILLDLGMIETDDEQFVVGLPESH